MKLAATLILAFGTGLVEAWLPSSHAHRSLTSLQLSTTVSPDSFTKPERVIMDELPTVYVYDHCPFCVRVRLALGIKNVKHKLYFMANDDVSTPTSIVGKKIAPIFVSLHEHGGTTIQFNLLCTSFVAPMFVVVVLLLLLAASAATSISISMIIFCGHTRNFRKME